MNELERNLEFRRQQYNHVVFKAANCRTLFEIGPSYNLNAELVLENKAKLFSSVKPRKT